jgi:hypothetical protein
MKLCWVKFVCGGLLLSIGLVISIPNVAALAVGFDPEHLTRKAELIILGKVKSKKIEKRTYIAGTSNGKTVSYKPVEIVVTDYEVSLEDTYKGSIAESEISILMLGGVTPDGYGWTDVSQYDLNVGEYIVAFLVYNKRNEVWQVYGGSQGVYKLKEDASNVENSIVTLAYIGHVVPRNPPPMEKQGLDAELTLQKLRGIITEELNQ